MVLNFANYILFYYFLLPERHSRNVPTIIMDLSTISLEGEILVHNKSNPDPCDDYFLLRKFISRYFYLYSCNVTIRDVVPRGLNTTATTPPHPTMLCFPPCDSVYLILAHINVSFCRPSWLVATEPWNQRARQDMRSR